MYFITRLKPAHAFQLRMQADSVIKANESYRDLNEILNPLVKAYPDFPNESKGSRQVLLESIRKEKLVGNIEVMNHIHVAVANVASRCGDAFRNCPDTTEKNLHDALHSFLWWSDIFRLVDLEINGKSAKPNR
jgi:hypothetical protein